MPVKTPKIEEKNVPKLRFPAFKGEWEEKRLGEIFSTIISRNNNGGVKNVLTNSAWKGVVNQKDYFDKDIGVQGNLSNYYVVEENDFVYNPRISKNAPVGPLKRNKLKRGVMSPLYMVLRPESENLIFLEKYFETSNWHRYMYKIANYGARHDRMAIAKNDFLKLPISLPGIDEQQKIASFLRSVDKWIENLKSQKKNIEQYKKGVMQKVFEPKESWKAKRLGGVARFLKGKGVSKVDIVDNGKNRCIRYGELYTSYSEIIDDVISKTNLDAKKTVLSKEGDLLVPSSGESALDIASVSCLKVGDVILGGDLSIMRLEDDGVPEFLAYYLSNFHKRNIARFAQGNSVVHLYSSHLKTLKIQVPKIQEQQKIANLLTSIDRSIESKEMQIKKVENWKKGLMQNLFL